MVLAMIRASLLALCLSAASAHADLLDAQASVEDGQARILLRFDTQPTLASATLAPEGLRILTRGAALGQAALIPPEESVVARIASDEDGAMTLALRRPVSGARVEIVENALLITAALRGAGTAEPQGATLAMDPIPDPDPAQDPAASTSQGDMDAPAADTQAEAGPAVEPEPDTPSQSPQSGQTQASDTPGEPAQTGGEAAALFAARLDEAACQSAAQAVEADPWTIAASLRLAACRAREGEAETAREIYERVLTFDPYNAEAEAGLGALAQDSGDAATARERYEAALDKSPGDGLAALVRRLMASL